MDLYKQMFYCVMFVIVVFSQYCKELLEISDLIDIERKMDLYKQMFYCVMFVMCFVVSTVRNYWRFLI